MSSDSIIRSRRKLCEAFVSTQMQVILPSAVVVNFLGVARVLDDLAESTKFAADYKKAAKKEFFDHKGKAVGETKKAGKGAGNLAFTSFKNAGHMVPHDDPVAALTMFSRWLDNKPLAK
nr:uncharacterized protein CI109_002216 [Kwoniella shandongensis]KAA5529323.1 hypothetical protein CI109_002216 [Kwoniella shandongensis]